MKTVFYFDQITSPNKTSTSLKLRSMVGLVPLFAVCVLKHGTTQTLVDFRRRTEWFLENKPHLRNYIRKIDSSDPELNGSYSITIPTKDRFVRIIRRVLDEGEFLARHGVRSLSKSYSQHPFEITMNNQLFTVRYTPAEGDSDMFGGNSNWRGPIWFPVNMLLINAIERYSLVYGEDFCLECPVGSGNQLTLVDIAAELSRRLISIFLPDNTGNRPCHAHQLLYSATSDWCELILFNEYFSGDDGRGVGASHQTGWTALVASLIYGLYTPHERRFRVL